jgi:uncharacterized membrane protein
MKGYVRLMTSFLRRDAGSGDFKPTVSDYALLAVLLLGFSLRLYRLSHLSLWTDEVVTVIRTRDLPFADLSTYPDFVMYWIQSLFYQVFPYGDFFFRLPSALMGTAGLLLMYLVARECLGTREALVAAFLLAFSPFHVHYSQEVRQYANMTLFTLGIVWCLLRGLGGGNRWFWFGFGAFGLLNTFNHPVGPFVTAVSCVVGAILALFWRKESNELAEKPSAKRRLLQAAGPFAAWGLAFLAIYGAFCAAVRPDLLKIVLNVFRGSGAGIIGDTTGQTTVLAAAPLDLDRLEAILGIYRRFEASSLPGITLAFVLVGMLSCIPRFARGLALCLVFLLSAAAMIALLRFRMVPFPRYFIWALPFFIMLQARGIVVIAGLVARATRRYETWPWLESSITALLAIVLFGALAWPLLAKEYYTEKGIEFKRMAQFLEDRCRTGEPVLLDGLPSREELHAGLSIYLYDPVEKKAPGMFFFEAAGLDELREQWSDGWYIFKISPTVGVEPLVTSTSARFPGICAQRIRLASPEPIPIPKGSFEVGDRDLAQSAREISFAVPTSYLAFGPGQTGGHRSPGGWHAIAQDGATMSLDRLEKSDGQQSLRVEMASPNSYFHAMSHPVLALPGYVFEASAKMKTSGSALATVYAVLLNAQLQPIDYLPLLAGPEEDGWTVLRSAVPGGIATFHGGGETLLRTCFSTVEETAAISMMLQVEKGTTSGTVVWFDDVRLKGGWDPALALANLVDQRREFEIAEAKSSVQALARELQETTNTADLLGVIAKARAAMETCKRVGFPASVWQLAESVIRVFPEAVKTTETLAMIAEGKTIIEICKQIGFSDGAERLVTILSDAYPDRKDLCWLSKSVQSVVVHKYDWLKDPMVVQGCNTISQDSDWLKGDVARHAYIFPRGHGRPFLCDGSYAIQLDLRIATRMRTSTGRLRIYLNTRSGLGPGGTDWGEFDAFNVPVDVSGAIQSYTIPVRSSVETAKFIHEIRIDPLDGDASYSLAIGNVRLVRLESSLASKEPPPEGFIPFQVGAQNVFSISTRRPLSSTSPLLLDYSPLTQLETVVLNKGEHILSLPKGWSADDVLIRAAGREYSGEEFESIYGGAIENKAAQMFIQNAKFDIPTSLTAKTEYAVGVEAQNSRIGPVVIVLRAPDGKMEMARFTFDRKDDSISWQEKRIIPDSDLNRISFAFMSDYSGPEGDLNARVSRVRVVRIEPAGAAK